MAGDATAPGDANQVSVPHDAAVRLQFLPRLQSEDERFVLRVDQQDEVAVARQRGAVHPAIVAPWRRPAEQVCGFEPRSLADGRVRKTPTPTPPPAWR